MTDTKNKLDAVLKLLHGAAIELENCRLGRVRDGITEAQKQLAALSDELDAATPADEQPVYIPNVGVIAVPVEPDKWQEREDAVLIRPRGHAVTVRTPDGEAWMV